MLSIKAQTKQYNWKINMQTKSICALVQQEIEQIDHIVAQCLNSDVKMIHQLAEHVFGSGGKRIRPTVVILGAKAFTYSEQHHLNLAAAVELIHTATLLHDDVVDLSTLRRGQKTANTLWGNEATILVGDFLYSRSFQLMVDVGNLPILSILAKASNIITEGEILQLTKRRDTATNENEYQEIIRGKTAALFEASAQIGALLCQRPAHEIQAMAQYGLNLGIAYQLIDDVMDYTSTSEDMGKNLGDDLAEGKPTLPLIYAMQHGDEKHAQFIREAIQNPDANKINEILDIVNTTGALEYTNKQAQHYAERAVRNITFLVESEYKNALHELASVIVERNH